MQEILQDRREETQNAEPPVKPAAEFVCESLTEQRRELRASGGVFLSTMHAAMGQEFAHVLVAAGGWDRVGSSDQREEEHRLYWVAMTRACETLCLFEPGSNRGFTREWEGDFLLAVVQEKHRSVAAAWDYGRLGSRNSKLTWPCPWILDVRIGSWAY